VFVPNLGYAAFVLGRVGPVPMASAALKRAAQRLRTAGEAFARPVSDGELLAAFGARHVSALPAALQGPRLRAHWSNRARALELRALCAQDPALAELALARADRIRAGRLQSFGRAVSAPGRWRRDPVTGHVFAGPGEPPNLPRVGAGDPKRVWALGRMDWAVALAQGTWLAGDAAGREYVAALERLCDGLLREAPAGEGIFSASPTEVALRSMNLALTLSMLRGHPALTGPFLLRGLRALAEGGRFVADHLEDGTAVPNNHLIADRVGLLHLALLFPELPGARRWRALASPLARDLDAQVLPDGLGFEGSTAYHLQLLELGILAHGVARAAGLAMVAELSPVLGRMFLATAGLRHADGAAPQVGDCDSDRILPVADRTERPRLGVDALVSLGAALLGDGRLKAPGAAFPPEAAWLLGKSGRERFCALPAVSQRGSQVFQSFGLAMLRAGEASLSLRAGGTGQRGVGGHGHNDQLGIELRLGAAQVIVDPGTGSYLGDPALRNRLRGTAMHSTVQVQGREQAPLVPGRPFALPDRARGRITSLTGLTAADGSQVATAEHSGYAPVVHRREVALWPHAALVLDTLTGPSAPPRALVSRLHLPDCAARMRAVTAAERTRLTALGVLADWDLKQAVELGPEGAPRAVWVAPMGGVIRVVPSVFAVGYDQLRPACAIEVSLRAPLPVRLAAAILFLGR